MTAAPFLPDFSITPAANDPSYWAAEEIADGSFRIAGGSPGMKLSWLVTGVRQDAYAEMNRIEVEVEKPVGEKGTYLHPDAYGRYADNLKFKIQTAK